MDSRANRIEALRAKPWARGNFAVPPQIDQVPSMLTYYEKRMLYYLARHEFAGDGSIADLGTYLGSSTICFATGLRERGLEGPLIHAYDLFKAESGAEVRGFPGDPPADGSTRKVFEDNLRDYLDLLEIHEGDILGETWPGGPIEILFIDIAKSYRTFDHLLLTFFPALLPGRSLVVMQDYLWGTTGPWHHVVMEKLADYCEYVVDNGSCSAVFLLTRAIPRAILEDCLYANIPRDEKIALMDRAIEKLDTPEKRQYLLDNREILVSGKDMKWGMRYHSS